MTISCAAIICVRNEELHIKRAINDFINQGIDVIIIDNGSTDNTLNICSESLGNGLLFIKHMPWEGAFDLSQQLEIKKEIVATINHDWVIHADADEWRHSTVNGESLLSGIARQSENGFNVINFEEFVFLPVQDKNSNLEQYQYEFLDYYYFSPHKNRRMNAWKRSLNFDNRKSGGHQLSGENINISPESFILRHYIVLSYKHAVEKYCQRTFSKCDLEKNWHKKRLHIQPEKLELPYAHKLQQLDKWNNFNLDFSNPKKEHYWNW